MGCSHKVVIHCVSKMVGWDSVTLKQHEILVVHGDLKLALDQIGKGDLLFRVSVCIRSKNPSGVRKGGFLPIALKSNSFSIMA